MIKWTFWWWCFVFLIEVHAYKIGNSDPAPQFKVIEQPNDFVNQVKKLINQVKNLNKQWTID